MLDTRRVGQQRAPARARRVDAARPRTSQQQTLSALGERAQELVGRFVEAWERTDVDTLGSMLTEDATFTMLLLATWYETREGIRIWASHSPMSGEWRWKAVVTRANGQPALAFYSWDEESQTHIPFALNILTFEGDKISEVDAFIVRSTESPDPESYRKFPLEPFDPRRLEAAFKRFGVPETLS